MAKLQTISYISRLAGVVNWDRPFTQRSPLGTIDSFDHFLHPPLYFRMADNKAKLKRPLAAKLFRHEEFTCLMAKIMQRSEKFNEELKELMVDYERFMPWPGVPRLDNTPYCTNKACQHTPNDLWLEELVSRTRQSVTVLHRQMLQVEQMIANDHKKS